MPQLAFVDTETLGLDPDRHAIWEVGLILSDGTHDSELLWQIHLSDAQIAHGDPVGMKIGRFKDRYKGQAATDVREFLSRFLNYTEGCHLVGAVPSFDEERLRRLAILHGFWPKWHYHLIDVEAMAVGALAQRGITPPLPWKSDDLTALLGVEPVSAEDRHTALGDARWAKRIYDAIMAGG